MTIPNYFIAFLLGLSDCLSLPAQKMLLRHYKTFFTTALLCNTAVTNYTVYSRGSHNKHNDHDYFEKHIYTREYGLSVNDRSFIIRKIESRNENPPGTPMLSRQLEKLKSKSTEFWIKRSRTWISNMQVLVVPAHRGSHTNWVNTLVCLQKCMQWCGTILQCNIEIKYGRALEQIPRGWHNASLFFLFFNFF